MSSTIGIIPTKNTEVTFGEIINLSEKYINSSLNTIQLKEKIKLQIHILNYDKVENKESYHEVDLTDIYLNGKKINYSSFLLKVFLVL